MGEGLREIAECDARLGIEFFGKEADVVRRLGQPVERLSGAVEIPLARHEVGRPRRADAEGALARDVAIEAPRVAVEEAVTSEFLLDPSQGRAEALPPRIAVVDPAHLEEARVRDTFPATVELGDVAVVPLAEAAGLDRRPQRVTVLAEPLERDADEAALGEPDQPV